MGRKILGISQQRVADQLGLTFQQVQKYEKGANRISASRLQQLCDILDAPMSFFFEGVPRRPGRCVRVQRFHLRQTSFPIFSRAQTQKRFSRPFCELMTRPPGVQSCA
jgi:transcriptional regulator with XRE-family HTH domain